ncbi:MAG: hypothetical protein WA484_11200 [Solirubrobacteraceae bacterium]
MPGASTSTVVPSVAFEALFTTTALSPLDDDVVPAEVEAACDEGPEPFELLPHAANTSDAASTGMTSFKAECI